MRPAASRDIPFEKLDWRRSDFFSKQLRDEEAATGNKRVLRWGVRAMTTIRKSKTRLVFDRVKRTRYEKKGKCAESREIELYG
jgi:hypothetical protein